MATSFGLNPRTLAAAAGVVGSLATAACSSLLFGAANLPAAFGDYTRVQDVAYGAADREKLDVYAPSGFRATDARPIVVFFYGGSWSEGSKDQYKFVGATLAEAGYVVAIPDYRLYPEVVFPELMEDGARAVAWVKAHATEYGGDPAQMFLMGHSAGAHMAALLAVEPSYLREAGMDRGLIKGLIGLSGPYALVPGDPKMHAIFGPPYTPANWQPVAHVSADDPPALLVHGADDGTVYPNHTTQMTAALEGAGIRVETHIYPDRAHADTVAALSVPGRGRAPVLEQIAAFIASLVEPDQPRA